MYAQKRMRIHLWGEMYGNKMYTYNFKDIFANKLNYINYMHICKQTDVKKPMQTMLCAQTYVNIFMCTILCEPTYASNLMLIIVCKQTYANNLIRIKLFE